MSDKVKKIVIIIIIAIFSFVFLICSHILIKRFLYFEEVEKETTKLIQDVIQISQNNKSDEMVINWEKIKNINKDIIGWIKINGTKIDYPIMQDKNLYYLNHTYEKKYNINGSIFTQTSNPFETLETIIYGHNNRNSLMFSEIENYLNQDFFNNHQTFKIYTKSANYDAKVFSIYTIGEKEERDNIKNLNFDECVEYYKKQSKIKVENEKKPENIIKLATCSYQNNELIPTEKRYYLVAFLTKS